jgi:flagellin-like protein
MKFKAISPLVAAVLLVAITMTIAGMLAFWASSFIKGQTEVFENQTQQTKCSFANLEVFDCTYDASTKTLTLVLQNTGGIEFNNLTANIVYSDSTVETKELSGTLGVAELKSYTITNLTSNITISQVIVKSKECPTMPGASSACS